MLTPEIINRIINDKKYANYRAMHNMNLGNTLLKGCTPGAVFSFNGNQYIYIGVNGRNRKFPLIAVDVESRKTMKFTRPVFERVRVGL